VLCDSPPALRRALSTTQAMESLHYALRKVRKGRGAFPNDEAIVKLLSMGWQHVATKWTQPIPAWKAALNQFVILFGERVPM
jgi:putative transposase